MSKPTILIIARSYPITESARVSYARNSYERLTADLAKDLSDDGFKVTILTIGLAKSTNHDRDGSINILSVPVYARKQYLGHVNGWYSLYRAARKLPRFDMILTISDQPFSAIAGTRLACQKQSSHVHWCHEILPDIWPLYNYKLPKFLYEWLDRNHIEALKQSDHVIVSGRCMKEHLIYKGLDDRSLSIIPPWANSQLGGSVEDDLMTNRQDIKHTDPTILFRVIYAGSVSGATPVSPILEAAMHITKEFDDIEFVFVGEGTSFDKIAAFKARHGLDRVKILPTPPQANITALLGSGDVHVVSLKDDATGLTVPLSFYNAMASHRPVVCLCNEQSEMARCLEQYPFGDVVSLQDIDRLKQSILKYRHDRHEWFNAHQAGIVAHTNYNHDTAKRDWLRVIKSSFKPIV